MLGPNGGTTSVERRFYLTRHDPTKRGGQKRLNMARGHWGVENWLHRCLDVSFDDDQCRIRKGHGAQNFSHLCRIALNLLKTEKTRRLGIANKRLLCSWEKNCLMTVLMSLGRAPHTRPNPLVVGAQKGPT